MLIQTSLKIQRLNHHYTQAQVAQQLFVSTQAVSKWELGQTMTSIDNLLALSDLYNLSLDELIQGSPFFKKPYLVGHQYNYFKGIIALLVWGFITAFFTGFGTQPIWLTIAVFLLGVIIVLPVVFQDYWLIGQRQLEVKSYQHRDLGKLKQLLMNRPTSTIIDYQDIITATVIYKRRQRLSPFDFNPDLFVLQVKTVTQTIELPLTAQLRQFFPQFINFLARQKITVINADEIVDLIVNQKSIYNHFNRQSSNR